MGPGTTTTLCLMNGKLWICNPRNHRIAAFTYVCDRCVSFVPQTRRLSKYPMKWKHERDVIFLLHDACESTSSWLSLYPFGYRLFQSCDIEVVFFEIKSSHNNRERWFKMFGQLVRCLLRRLSPSSLSTLSIGHGAGIWQAFIADDPPLPEGNDIFIQPVSMSDSFPRNISRRDRNRKLAVVESGERAEENPWLRLGDVHRISAGAGDMELNRSWNSAHDEVIISDSLGNKLIDFLMS